MTIWCMHFACWTPKSTVTHSEYVIHITTSATVVAQTCVNVTLYIHCLSCLFYIPTPHYDFDRVEEVSSTWTESGISFWRERFI